MDIDTRIALKAIHMLIRLQYGLAQPGDPTVREALNTLGAVIGEQEIPSR